MAKLNKNDHLELKIGGKILKFAMVAGMAVGSYFFGGKVLHKDNDYKDKDNNKGNKA
ncbi:hypothetical protein [Butyrivibrio sp. AE2005]|uniref:hypothetical protein n=1 Tax=Butyrivibrio sp. AE2005 TaxID=1496722 RepID=UPI000AD8D76E|nr:hypothetical protein [Butyrivibrio sp. AE2005]